MKYSRSRTMPQKPKQFYAIACCLLLIGNVSFGMHLVVCKTGPDISVEFAHAPHCGAAEEDGHHSSADHDHNDALCYSKSCSPCTDFQLIVDYHFSKHFPEHDALSSAYPQEITFITIPPDHNAVPYAHKTSNIRIGYYPAITVLRV